MKNYISNQSGRSMIEMLGVLAIVGVLSVAGIAGYSKAMAKYKTNKLIDQVSTVAANIRTTFIQQGTYKGLDTKTAYQLGIFPEEIAKDCASKEDFDPNSDNFCIRNAFAGGVVVMEDHTTYTSPIFGIGISGISKDACSTLLLSDWGSNSTFLGILRTEGMELGDLGDLSQFISLAKIKENGMKYVSDMCTASCIYEDEGCTIGFVFR